ncbi:CATRA conflict system CASPASE/TPR repeat-associated protein [Streptomyces sp. NPDC059850]|uniref:CATRA conflict system CASPASE/TPR repeat-associated protein n=1 Tax=Streptomyces sp. NPDC059850 TaxID=3346970 RepID=UPI00364F9067
MTLTDQSLVVHLFVATTGPRRSASYRRLREVWAACGTQLGMVRSAAATGLPDTLPEELAGLPAAGAVAARRDRAGLAQAVLRRHHDLLCLSVALSPVAGERGAWDTWDRRWTRIAGADGGPEREWVVGEARLFVAYRAPSGTEPVGVRELVGAIRAELPLPLGPGVVLARPEVTLWEATGDSATRPSRRFVAVADDGGDGPRDTELWLWSQGGDAPPPFARYLADAAKLRYETRVHAAHDSDLASPAGAVVDGALAALDRASPDDDTADDEHTHDRGEELARWRTRLLSLTAGSTGLTQWITRLREMRTTVCVAEANMRAQRDAAGVPEGGHGPFAEDLALAAWFVQRLGDGLVYLEADRERARDALTALTVEAEHALQRRRELTQRQEVAAQQRQSKVNLLQSAFLGAVLMVLAAIQSFAYEVPFLPPPAVPALIALLGALALLLATLVLWLATPPESRAPARLGSLLAGLVGATAGWLASTVAVHAATGRAAPDALTWAVALPAFGCGWLVMRRRLLRADGGSG